MRAYISISVKPTTNSMYTLLAFICSNSQPFSQFPFCLEGAETNKKMRTKVEEKFSNFYDKWMSQLEDLLQLLLIVSKAQSQEAAHTAMVNKLTAHQKEYYKFKWAAAHDDILAFFGNPIWLSPLESAHLWITGWKPSTAFRLVESLRLSGVTEEQLKKIEALRMKIKVEEERVEREMERQQVAVADRKMVELARLEKRVKTNGSAAAVAQVNAVVEVAVQGWLGGLERVMKMADCVRLKTLKGLLDILSPMQCVDFLASKSMLQIRIRKWGQMPNRDKKIGLVIMKTLS